MPKRYRTVQWLEKVPGQCDGIIAADPFLSPTKKFPGSISAAEQLGKEVGFYQDPVSDWGRLKSELSSGCTLGISAEAH